MTFPTIRTRGIGWLAVCWLLLGAALIAWVVLPVVLHAHVRVALPAADVVQRLRASPDAALLAMLAAQRPLGPRLPADAVALAEHWIDLSRRGGRHPLRQPVLTEDFERDHGIEPLAFASLYAPDVLVAAHAASGRAEHLALARELIVAFVRFERSAWRDRGLLWNDHAIAARIGVLLRFWHAWRGTPAFDAGVAAELLQHVARCAQLLARASHFTAWSNHGVMQNIALLQAAAAFPGVIDAAALRSTALERLQRQWGYYISPEGVVLEHSAGYHAEGLILLQQALALLRLNGIEPPAEWPQRLALAEAFLARITRPDGTLPAYGDTYVEVPPAQARPADPAALPQLRLFPLSGYALIESRAGTGPLQSHAMLTWSHFAGQAHKHADEGGVVLWAAGRGWVTPSGYAPYASAQRVELEGWLGSNAPHRPGEGADPQRQARLLGSAGGEGWVLLDVERSAAGGGGYRRQLLQLGGCRWLVIDHPLGAAGSAPMQTVWTFLPDLTLAPLDAARWTVRDPGGSAELQLQLLGSSPPRSTMHRGARDPALGWIATRQGLVAAPALRVQADPRGWSGAQLALEGCGVAPELRVQGADAWQLAAAGWRLRREAQRVIVERDGAPAAAVAIAAPSDVGAARAAIDRAREATLEAYPKYRNVDHYRLRMAGMLALLWFGLIIASWVVARLAARRPALAWPWHGALLAGWIGVGLWLKLVYFAA